MALFVTKDGKRKSPMALVCFFMVLAYCAIYGVFYVLLVEPLYTLLPLGGGVSASFVHSAIISAIGTAACCLFFLLKDKRIVPYSFACLPLVAIVFCVAAYSLDAERRDAMLNMILMYSLMPVVIGNAVSWVIYLKAFKKPADDTNK